MADNRFKNFDDPTLRYTDEANPEVNRLYPEEDRRSNASLGWIVGAVVLLGVLVYAFGWKGDPTTASNPTPPITTSQNRIPVTPGPITPTPAPSATPAPAAPAAPSTTGSGSVQ